MAILNLLSLEKKCSIPILVTLLLVCTRCSEWFDVSSTFRVDSGIEPKYQDDQVRFRTTYYLRVFDFCDVAMGKESPNKYKDRLGGYIKYGHKVIGGLTSKEKGELYILKDSLHRFRMTGKASALFNDLHFESGVMDAKALDPFGQTVDFSEETGKFVSPRMTDSASSSFQSQVSENLCPSGNPIVRKFFLLGPEGMRELLGNERLVMAMYTNAKPLINSLNQLAGQKSNQEAKASLPFDLEFFRAQANQAIKLIENALKEETVQAPQKIAGDILKLLGDSSKALVMSPSRQASETKDSEKPSDGSSTKTPQEMDSSDLLKKGKGIIQ